jgi:acyl-[acyl-carrier-protein]-phospholipid O-acyltransferase/long-chain-fatty-acid--[acyl-carrier-protein] ligase
MATPLYRRRSYFPFLTEVITITVARLLYRVRSSGVERIPATGGAILIANHLSYVDVIVLQLACPRPLRFIGYKGLGRHWFFDWVFRMSGVIPITAKGSTEGIRLAVKALKAGEIVCVFPEGQISRTGQLMEMKKGFEVMARLANVPVIPAAHDGLWGSIFSFAGNKYLWKSPRLLPTPVFVAFGAPIPAEKADGGTARRALLNLGAEAFEQRPILRRNLAREVVRALAKQPGRIAVIDRTAERRELRAAQLLAAAAVLSRRLRTIAPEKRVGIVLPPGAGAFIANLATICAGKVPVNLNFTAGRSSLEASLRLGEITTVISAHVMRSKLPNFPWPEKTLDLRDELTAAGGKRAMVPWLIAAWVLPNQFVADLLRLPHAGDREEAGLLFTSGSSGEPKGVLLSHRNILANCAQVSSLSILPQTCTMLACLPIFHSFGFTVTLWYPLLRGAGVVTVPSPLETRKIIDGIKEEGATTLIAAPTFVRPILKKAKPGELRTLSLVVTGAEKLPEDLYRTFLENFHLEIYQGYGLTETAPVSNVNQPNPPIVTETGEFQIGKKPGAVGRLLPGMTARIVHPETGADLPLTETGVVWLKGSNVFTGYLHDAEKTAAALRDGWFVTGDLGRFDLDGFLYIEGRLSRFSKIGGEMVPHGTVENKILEVFDWVTETGPMVAVVGVPDAAKGEALVLLTTMDVTVETVREKLLAAGLPSLWVPKVLRRVENIPMLGTGKMDLKTCKVLAQEAAGVTV